MRKRALLTALSTVLMMSACSVGQGYEPKSTGNFAVPESYSASPNAPETEEIATWWKSLNDPVLDELIDRASQSNTDIAAATARLRAARALVEEARGGTLPSIGASIQSGATQSVVGGQPSGQNLQVGIDAAWEVDLFGRQARTIESARANAAASQYTLFDVERSIAAELALNYVEARSLQARLAVARENLGIQEATLQIAEWRFKAGLVSGLDVEQARTQRGQTAAGIPQLEQAYAAAINRISVLAVKVPSEVRLELASPESIPTAPDGIGAGLPAELLHRRPDVRAAEAALASEIAKTGAAQADLYPALRLSGTLSSSATSIDSLGSSIVGNLIGGITAPIFQGGKLRARLHAQQANADAALANYRGSILRAVEEVENALAALDASKNRESELRRAEVAARAAQDLAAAKYRAGLVDFQTLLDTQRNLVAVQDGLITAHANRTAAAIQLYKALGGGWQETKN